jgi:hypothetical protein
MFLQLHGNVKENGIPSKVSGASTCIENQYWNSAFHLAHLRSVLYYIHCRKAGEGLQRITERHSQSKTSLIRINWGKEVVRIKR